MSDRVFHQDDARYRVLEGAKILYEAVKTTMGPKGHNVIIGKGLSPTVTHDGVTVARNIEIDVVDDATLGQKVGADLIKEAAIKMNDVAGDGTTTVTVLMYHILNEANKLITAGYSPMTLRRELEAAGEEARNLIKGTDITGDKEKMSQVAFISAADKMIGDMVAEIIGAIGKDGAVTIQASQEVETKADVVEGFTFPRGMQSPFFALDPAKGEAELDTPGILLVSGKIYDMSEIMPVLEALIKEKRPLLLIAEEIGPDVIANLVLNKMKSVFLSCAVVVPGYQKDYLRDIAAVTGATIFGTDTGNSLQSFKPEDLGRAISVVVGKQDTTIVQGLGNTADLLKELNKSIEDAKSEFEKETLEKRRAALQGKVAVIKVGGGSDTEIEEKTYRIEDAVAAVKASLEDGIVPGCGVTLLEVSKQLKADTDGAKLLKRALEQPFRILLENADLEPAAYMDVLKPGEGVNLNTLKIVDLLKAGIIDPAAVTKKAIQNAVSVAGTAMTMGALIVPIPKENKGETT